ncbi:MAG TPA: non-canonical purine NTP pyrophosphatase [Candidatus Elarobacter sp.]|jgi:XTP/dITP diphosphohydrolase
MRVYVATKNAGKLREMEALFADAPVELAVYPAYEPPDEGETSYGDNAALKARALRGQLLAAGIRAGVLADDSGLEVEALGGRPGVTTAIYGGASASWSDRRARLLGELATIAEPDRGARFVCVLHFIGPDGRELAATATVRGAIPAAERGRAGFSFDPVFFYPPAGRTFAELGEEEKNRVSHRAVAAAGLIAMLATAELATPEDGETAR